MQVELLGRKHRNTRTELPNAVFEYIEIFHNRERRHSALGMLSPVEYEARHHQRPAASVQELGSRDLRRPKGLRRSRGDYGLDNVLGSSGLWF